MIKLAVGLLDFDIFVIYKLNKFKNIMKKLLFVFTFFTTLIVAAQTLNQVELEKNKLKQALIYGDQATATVMMYNIIALEGEKSAYKDSLAYLYFNRRSYLSCYLSAADALKNNPTNTEILEMSAFSLESLGAKDKAIDNYQKLLAITKNNFHAFKIAGLQLELKKVVEAYTSIKKAESLVDKGTEKITYPINKSYNQQVPLKASIQYLKGIIEVEMNSKELAKKSFQKAIGLFPEFILAKQELENLNEIKSKE